MNRNREQSRYILAFSFMFLAFCEILGSNAAKMRTRVAVRKWWALADLTLLFGMGLLAGCGGQGTSGPPSGVTSVTVTPLTASVKAGQTQQFQATVTASRGVSTAVTWSASPGTISSAGLYTAPASVPNPSTVTVTATSVADTTKSQSAKVSVFLIQGVTISPGSATLQPGQGQKFTATVQGQGTFDMSVTWQVNQIPGGNSFFGTIGADGSYTAPAALPNPDPVTIQAVSNADKGASGSASVGIAGITGIVITPNTTGLFPGQSQQFTATVQGIGTFDPTLVWSVQGSGGPAVGTVTQRGLYQLPNSVSQATQETIIATSAADSYISTFASAFDYANPVFTSLGPNQGSVGDSLNITGQNLDAPFFVTFSGPNGVPISTQGWQGDSTSALVIVPHDAVNGPVTLQEYSGTRVSAVSNSVQFTRTPSLRIRADSFDLSPAETTALHAEVLGQNNGQTITWSTDLGSISVTGTYMAPGAVPGDAYSHVSGCIENTQVCDSLIVGVHPFEVQPRHPVVALGNSLQFSAEVGGAAVGATWQLATGGGTLSGSGAYTAGSTAPDGGLAEVSASYGGSSETSFAAVTGGFPGMISYRFEYVDNRQQPGRVTSYASSPVLSGNKMFVLASPTLASYLDQTEYFVDQYDVTNLAAPVWMSSTEAVGPAQIFVQGNYLYEVGIDTPKYPEPMTAIATFDISGKEPLLVSRTLIPQISITSVVPGFAYASPLGFLQPPVPPNTGLFYQLDLRAGIPVVRELMLPYPVPNDQPVLPFWLLTGNGSRLYTPVVMSAPTTLASQWLLAEYDLTQDPPVLLNSIQTPVVAQPALIGNTLFVGGTIYDVSGSQPMPIATLPNLQAPALDTLGNLLLTEDGSGVSVVDLSSPSQPKVLNLLTSDTDALSGARFAGPNRLITTGYPSNLSIYDDGTGGGPFPQAPLTEALTAGAVLDQQATSSNLFVAIESGLSNFVAVFDATTSPLQSITRIDMGSANPLVVQAVNNVLYVGTDQALLVYDISSISSPQQVTSINSPTMALAAAGKTLFAATTGNQLLAYDISNATSPTQIFSGTLTAPTNFLRTAGTLLLVPDTTAGLLIYDVSQPSAPSLLAQWNPSKSVLDVTTSGSQAFLATDAGLFVADLTNPSKPVQIGQGKFPASQQGNTSLFGSTVALQDGIAYLGTANTGAVLYGFDVRNPASPRLVSMSAYGSELDAEVLSLSVTPSQLNVGGFFSGVNQAPLVPMDLAQPRNIILTSQGQPAALAAARKATRDAAKPPWIKSARKMNFGPGQSKLRVLQWKAGTR